MYKEYFPVQFSVLSSRALEKAILSKYSIKRPFKCQFFTPGLNDIYIVRTPEETYYLRISIYGWRNKEELEAEIELLNYLHNLGISVAIPVPDNEGKYIQEINAPEGIRYAVLFTEAKGEKNDNPDQKKNYFSRLYGS